MVVRLLNSSAIDQVREAEKEVERLLINAETQSAHIIKTAEQAADSLLQDQEAMSKSATKKSRDMANAKGEKLLASALAQAETEIQALQTRADSNRQTAIDAILSTLS